MSSNITTLDILERFSLDSSRYPLYDDVLEIPNLTDWIDHVDHLTFVTAPHHLDAFAHHWQTLGYELRGEWPTRRYPARHIAFTRGAHDLHPWQEMVGLSVSDSPTSPVNRALASLDRHGRPTHCLQHVALHVQVDLPMVEARRWLAGRGLQMLTDVLTYHDPSGAQLHQFFTRTEGGFFVEFIQRGLDRAGHPFGAFSEASIDDLYQALDRDIAAGPAS